MQRCVWCCGHGHCAMHGVKGTVITPHVVLQVLSLCGCGGHHVAVTFVVWPWWVSPCHVVSQSQLLCHGGCCRTMLCCGRDGCVTPCGVAVAGVTPRVVSWASHHMVLWSWWLSLCCVVLQL